MTIHRFRNYFSLHSQGSLCCYVIDLWRQGFNRDYDVIVDIGKGCDKLKVQKGNELHKISPRIIYHLTIFLIILCSILAPLMSFYMNRSYLRFVTSRGYIGSKLIEFSYLCFIWKITNVSCSKNWVCVVNVTLLTHTYKCMRLIDMEKYTMLKDMRFFCWSHMDTYLLWQNISLYEKYVSFLPMTSYMYMHMHTYILSR